MVFYLQNTNLHRVGINCEIFHEKHAHRITFITLKTNLSSSTNKFNGYHLSLRVDSQAEEQITHKFEIPLLVRKHHWLMKYFY